MDKKVSARNHAKVLRKRMTQAVVILWSRLRRNAIAGRRFREQHPIGPYVADFACLPVRLVVEVDGATRRRDRRRDAYLRRRGFRILRFANVDIYDNLEGVLDRIWSEVPSRRPQP